MYGEILQSGVHKPILKQRKEVPGWWGGQRSRLPPLLPTVVSPSAPSGLLQYVSQAHHFVASEGYHVGTTINNRATRKTGKIEGNIDNCAGGGGVKGRIRCGGNRSMGLLFVASAYKVCRST
jgi:hypothetical protein